MTWPQPGENDPYQQGYGQQQPPYEQPAGTQPTSAQPYSPGPTYPVTPAPEYQAPEYQAGYPPQEGYPQGYQQQPYPAQPYQPQGYPPPGYAQGQGTNTMAILALVLAFFFSPLGIIFGHIARKQIRQSGEQGDGLALAGMIIGYVSVGLGVLACCLGVVVFGVFGTGSASG